MSLLRTSLVAIISITATTVIFLNVLLMTASEQPYLEDKVTQYGNYIEEASFYFNIVLFLSLAVILAVVDVMLLRRLRDFYPTFYEQEKTKVLHILP